AAPGLLLDGTEPGLRRIAQQHAQLRVGIEETPVVQVCEVETEAAEIVGEKNGAANIGIDGLAESVRESETERQRGELVGVGDKAPTVRQERLHGEALLVTTLVLTVDHAEIVVAEAGVLPRCGAELGALRGAAPAEILHAERGVHPTCGSPVKFITEDEAFAGAISGDGHEQTGLADLGASRRSGVRRPDERDTK